jgi:hypothetical protein
MNRWFYKWKDYEQVINADATWTCTCPHGSIGRFKKDCNFPCIHVIVAFKKWAEEIIKGRKK